MPRRHGVGHREQGAYFQDWRAASCSVDGGEGETLVLDVGTWEGGVGRSCGLNAGQHEGTIFVVANFSFGHLRSDAE